MVEFSEEDVKGLLRGLRGVAVGVAEEFSLDYSKKFVFEFPRFLTDRFG